MVRLGRWAVCVLFGLLCVYCFGLDLLRFVPLFLVIVRVDLRGLLVLCFFLLDALV